ncbi:MAG: glycosyltransferase family 1 protein [Planctomycetota bacterium]|nr:glycosyltransferase family 1 protein [Planctomycetota bacterium]
MRIGVDARPALFGVTGFSTVAQQTMRALSRREGIEVVGYGAAWRRPRLDAPREGVVRRRIPARIQQALHPFGFGVETLLGSLDIFHHTDLVFAPVSRTPEVLTINDVFFLRHPEWHGQGFARRVEPRLRRKAKAAQVVVVPCTRVADEVLALRIAPAEKIEVVSYGADHIDSEPKADDQRARDRLLRQAGLSPTDDLLLVLAPGTREPRKNHRRLIEAFLNLEHTRAVLLLVGPPGWGCPDVEVLLREDPNSKKLATLGEVSSSEMNLLLRISDLVAYPSLAEGFGLPVAEAMACGRAVLTSGSTPMSDFGGEAVYTVDPHDVRALSVALGRLLDDPILRADLGRAAVSASAALTWESTAKQLVTLYNGILTR